MAYVVPVASLKINLAMVCPRSNWIEGARQCTKGNIRDSATVLFGIPGASFAAIVIGLFVYLDFELGIELTNDAKFDSMLYGFMLAT